MISMQQATFPWSHALPMFSCQVTKALSMALRAMAAGLKGDGRSQGRWFCWSRPPASFPGGDLVIHLPSCFTRFTVTVAWLLWKRRFFFGQKWCTRTFGGFPLGIFGSLLGFMGNSYTYWAWQGNSEMEFQWICKASGMVWPAKLLQVLALLAVNFGRFAMAQPCKNVLGPRDMVHSELVWMWQAMTKEETPHTIASYWWTLQVIFLISPLKAFSQASCNACLYIPYIKQSSHPTLAKHRQRSIYRWLWGSL